MFLATVPGVRPLPLAAAPKIANLARLQAAGVPVPPALALPDAGPPDAAAWAAIDELLRGGPVIVRAALLAEDTADVSAAGLGRSVPNCRDREAVRRALAEISGALADPWLRDYFAGVPAAQVLVQRQVLGPWLAVVADAELRHVELHQRGSDDEPLAAGATPALAGPLGTFPPALRGPVARLCDQVRAALPPAGHGLDLELVADHAGAIWVVQARPLTRPLHPGWPAFAAAARHELGLGADVPLPLPGLWVLDAEHNPAALSPAHAGLVRWLDATRPELGRMRVLAGWLYVPQRRGPRATAGPAELRRALIELRGRHIPAARERLTGQARELARVDGPGLAALLDRALADLVAVLAVHAALPSARPQGPVTAEHPLCLQDRAAHLDVLPAAWDIASPPLADLSPAPAPAPARDDAPLPTDPDVLAVLLGELDDHLFALGLAPVRRVYLQAAVRLGVSARDIFLFPPDDLKDLLCGAGHGLELARRRAEHEQHVGLCPPLQLYDGLPVPGPTGAQLRGLPVGPAAEGPLHARRDLEDLHARPLPAGAVLAIPALTAQAAVVLDALGVRAVCCEHGGALSHAALMARELGLSALIGCRGCTGLPAGTPVRLDPRSGRLLRLDGARLRP